MDSDMIDTRQTTDWREVWDDGLHIWAVGVPSSGSGVRVMSSTDGITWTPVAEGGSK